MKKIAHNLFVGNDLDCNMQSNFAIIHACKTCHVSALRYKGSLPSSNPYYLIYENENHLFLNMVDMDRELLPKFTHPIIKIAMDFIEKNIPEKNVLIHCNQGQSRSPSIGLIFLAKKKIINNSSYQEATTDYLKIYPDYIPGRGIDLYLQNNWNELLAL